jgi:nucleoside-diphosphate-sugar epimerase
MKSFAGRKILILGGMGFIGSNLAIRLVELGAEVTIVDSMLPQYGGNLANIEPVAGRCRVNFSDIRDRHSLDYLVQGVEVIYNMAGQTSHVESMADPLTDLEINCRSQLALLESCRAHNPEVKLVFASTRQLYGRPRYLPVDEEHPTEPVDVNGVNKLAAEKYYGVYSQVYGLRCVSLRMTNTYGPRQQLKGNKQGFAGIFIRRAIEGEKISIFGDGSQLRDFNYVDDVVEALLLSTDDERLYGKVYNLGSERRYSLLSFVEILARLCRFEFETVPFPPDHQAIDIGDYYADSSLFRRETGWAPEVDLEEGLRRTVEYFRPRIAFYV